MKDQEMTDQEINVKAAQAMGWKEWTAEALESDYRCIL